MNDILKRKMQVAASDLLKVIQRGTDARSTFGADTVKYAITYISSAFVGYHAVDDKTAGSKMAKILRCIADYIEKADSN